MMILANDTRLRCFKTMTVRFVSDNQYGRSYFIDIEIRDLDICMYLHVFPKFEIVFYF